MKNPTFENQLVAAVKLLSMCRVGNIATLAPLLDKLEALSLAAGKTEDDETENAANICEKLVRDIIMDTSEDPELSLEKVGQTIKALRNPRPKNKKKTVADPENEVSEGGSKTSGMAANPLVDDEIIREFAETNLTALVEVEACVLRMEKGEASQEDLGTIRRCFHTIKGEAGFLGLENVEAVCHTAEDLFEQINTSRHSDLLLKVVDWLRASILDLSGTGKPAGSPKAILKLLRNASNGASGGEEGIPSPPETDSQDGDTKADVLIVESKIKDGDATPWLPPEAGFWTLTGDTSLFSDFVSECKEHLEYANAEMLNLETDSSNEDAMAAVFRAFHTIKGTAGFLDLHELQRLSHDAENLLDLVRKGDLDLSHEMCDLVFDALDMMGQMLDDLKTAVEGNGNLFPQANLQQLLGNILAATKGNAPPTLPVERTEKSLGEYLVDTGVVPETVINEALASQSSETEGKKLGEVLMKENVAPKTIASALRAQKAEPKTGGSEIKESIRVSYERLENLVNAVGELVIAETMITQDPQILGLKSGEVEKKLHNLSMISRNLQEMGTSIRMVPIRGTFQKMSRLVRDLSSKSEKKIDFRTFGEETELDRAYVEKIGDPIVHMIRNAADHGIESPQERRAAGKSETGVIHLKSYHEGGNILIEISDDGRGLDKEKILSKAVERNLVPEGAVLSDQEIFDLILSPGFSTAKEVTEVSGRGVGMDVVKRNIQSLRGTIQTTTEPGKGTTFKLVLPLTMALIDGMVVRVCAEKFILPVLSVEEAIVPDLNKINRVLDKGRILTHRGTQIPLVVLAEMLNIPGEKLDLAKSVVVVVESNDRKMGLAVDELLGLQQTVIKNLGAGLEQTTGLAGGAIMVDGTVGLILDINGLFKMAGQGALADD